MAFLALYIDTLSWPLTERDFRGFHRTLPNSLFQFFHIETHNRKLSSRASDMRILWANEYTSKRVKKARDRKLRRDPSGV